MVNEQTVISKTELSKRLNRSKAMISKYVRQGLPVRPDGLVDLAAAERWFQENVCSGRSGSYRHDERIRAARSAAKSAKGGRPAKPDRPAKGGKPAVGKPAWQPGPGQPAPGDDATLTELQKRKLRVEIETRQHNLWKERGELAPITEVRTFIYGTFTKLRDELSRLPARLRDQFDVLTGAECESLLAAELLHILTMMKQYDPLGWSPGQPADLPPGQLEERSAETRQPAETKSGGE